MKPSSAIIAVTLNCNARCMMCDIWKQRSTNEMRPEEYQKLPASLKEINLTGGEPFLRHDLSAVVSALKQACPRARIVISSNGILSDRIRRIAPSLIQVDPLLAVRISLDGIGQTHDRVRGIPHSFTRAVQSLSFLREAGIRDLGIGMTVLHENVGEVIQVYELAEELGIEFSLTIASDSPIYFGEGKSLLRPQNKDELIDQFEFLISSEYRHMHPKRWFRAWFEKELLHYALEGKRSLPCDAGRNFFYLDPHGTVYCCHMQPHPVGSLRAQNWEALWQTPQAQTTLQEIEGCETCWMVCTARSQMRKRLFRIGSQIVSDKIKVYFGKSTVGQNTVGNLKELPK